MPADRCDIQVERQPGATVVRVRGVIDEHFDRASLAAALAAGHAAGEAILVDVTGVPRITSFGVREWLFGFRDGGTTSAYFVGVRPALIAQFNTVRQFGSAGFVVSLYCPYVCDACQKDFEILTDVRQHGQQLRAYQPPAATCPSCGKPASFDDVEQSYFATLVDHPLPPVPAAIEAILDGARPPAPRVLRVAKAVTDTVTALWLSGALDRTARFKRHADGVEGDVIVILDNVVSADAAGVINLGELARARGARVAFARVPLVVARALAAASSSSSSSSSSSDHAPLAPARVVSAIADALCPRCGAVTVDVTARVRGGGALSCSVCGDAIDLELDASYAALPWGDASAAVTMFLLQPMLDAAMASLSEDSSRMPKSPGSAPGSGAVSVARPSSLPGASAGGTQIGKYEIVRRIGLGGMAEVYLGRHVGLEGFEKKVVIKRILPHLAVQPAFVEQFLQEARVAARLTHPHIVQIFDLGRDAQSYFIVMELVSGHDFNALIRMAARLGEPVPIGVAARIVASLSRGLHAAHTYADDEGKVLPVLHRDVSPHNVLVGYDGAVKITDFGVAKASGSLSDTNAGTLKGKVLYMAPEHVLGHAVDHRIDIFATGLCLYYALVQQHPFARTSEVGALKAVLEAEIPPPSRLRADVPPELERIVLRAIERDTTRRYPSAEEMANDLERFLAQQASTATTLQDVGVWVRGLEERVAKMPVALRSLPRRESDATVTTPEGSLERVALSRAANGPAAPMPAMPLSPFDDDEEP